MGEGDPPEFTATAQPRTVDDVFGTEITLSGPDVGGLLACLTGQLYARGYDIHFTKGEMLSFDERLGGGGVRDTFVVTRNDAALAPEDSDALRMALIEIAAKLHQVKSAAKRDENPYLVNVVDDEVKDATVLIIEGPDAPGLLGAITSTLSASSCSIVSFGGETTSAGVRDRFVVQRGGQPLGSGVRVPLVRRLQEACRKLIDPMHAGEVEKRFAVHVNQGNASTAIVVDGPDVPGLLSKLSQALSSDGYEIVSFEAGAGGQLTMDDLSLSKESTKSGHSVSKEDSKAVHDVFHVTRDSKPLSEEEAAVLQQWICQQADSLFHDNARLMRSKDSTLQDSSIMDGQSAAVPTPRPKGGGFSLFSACRPKKGTRGGEPYTEMKNAKTTPGSEMRQLTALERQGLVAALQQKGEAITMAADLLHAGGKGVTDVELETLRAALGDGVLPDVMRRAQINPADIKVGELLGAGVFGEVREGVYHGTPVAIKTMHRRRIADGGLELFKQECELCLSLRHPNIVQLIGACWQLDAPTVFLVMERCECTLAEALKDAKVGRKDGFTRKVSTYSLGRVPILLGVARAMAYLHSQKPPILHRDLKPDNVLLQPDLTPKVSDFGSSRDVAKMAMTQVGTPLFSAPEIMAHEPYDSSADVWSFGCLISCCSRLAEEPYQRELLSSVGGGFNGVMRAIINGQLAPAHSEGPSELCGLGWKCNQLDPTKRLRFGELVELLQAEKMQSWCLAEDKAAKSSGR